MIERHKPNSNTAWRIVQSSANDNRASLAFWLRHILPWGIFIGLVWAWFLF